MKKVLATLLLFIMLSPQVYAQSSGGCVTVAPGLDSEEQKMIQLHNNYRAENGLPPFQISQKLNVVADNLAQDEATHGYSGHTDSQGRGMVTRFNACGISGGSMAENAGSYPSTQAMFDGWINSPGHKANILSNRVAMGVARAQRGNNWIWITDFASPNPGGTPTDDNSNPPDPTDTPEPTDTPNEITPTPDGQDNTPTPPTLNATVSVDLGIPGVGTNTFDNKTPKNSQEHATIIVSVEPYDSSGNLVDGTFSTPVNYNTTTGTFIGPIASDTLPSGTYTFKVRSENSLKKNAGTLNVTQNGIVILSKNLVTGDVVHDNVLNLLDYNAILSSYGPVTNEASGLSDLNMNQKVDEEDLNIFYTNLANRQGD